MIMLQRDAAATSALLHLRFLHNDFFCWFLIFRNCFLSFSWFLFHFRFRRMRLRAPYNSRRYAKYWIQSTFQHNKTLLWKKDMCWAKIGWICRWINCNHTEKISQSEAIVLRSFQCYIHFLFASLHIFTNQFDFRRVRFRFFVPFQTCSGCFTFVRQGNMPDLCPKINRRHAHSMLLYVIGYIQHQDSIQTVVQTTHTTCTLSNGGFLARFSDAEYEERQP